jgi:hypothetical protein
MTVVTVLALNVESLRSEVSLMYEQSHSSTTHITVCTILFSIVSVVCMYFNNFPCLIFQRSVVVYILYSQVLILTKSITELNCYGECIFLIVLYNLTLIESVYSCTRK